MAHVVPATSRFGTSTGRKLRIAVGDSVTQRKVRNQTASWGQIVDRLKGPVRTKERYSEYINAARERQDTIKDVGYYVPTHFEGSQRKRARMETRDMLTLDIDFAEANYLEAIRNAYAGWSFVAHSTHKHSPEEPRLRLVAPLTRAVTEDEHTAVARKIAELLGIDYFDDTTFEFSRVMHWPSVSWDGEYVCEVGEGAWIDPDEILGWYEDWRDVSQWPVSSRQAGKLRRTAERAEDPTAKRGVVGAFCRIYDIHGAIAYYLSETYIPSENAEDRYTYAPGTTSGGAVVYDEGLYLFSNHGTDPCSGSLVNAFDLVRLHRFGDLDDESSPDQRTVDLPSYKAMMDLAREDEDVLAELSADIALDFEGLDEDEVEDAEKPDGPDPESDEDDDLGLEQKPKKDHGKWLKTLQRDQKDALKANLHNLTTIINNDPKLEGCISLNEFTGDLVQRRSLPGWPLTDKVNGNLWIDHNDIVVKYRLETVYKIPASRGLVKEALDLVGYNNRWHPVREYLESLTWDGKPRVERLLIDYLGVNDTLYHREVARKTLAAAVTRVFEPGSKFDYVPILEGSQGTRKSSFVRVLFGGHWFTDGLANFDKTQQAVETMKGKWGIELAELHAFSKSEIEAAKAFISRQTDRVREAYAARAMDYPRQCVFIGSTNDSQYLTDNTGNRRYWPVAIQTDLIDTEALERERDQLWAEALTLYQAGESLDLSPEAKGEAQTQQHERLVTDDLTGIIEEWLDEPVDPDYLEYDPGETDFVELHEKARRDRVCAVQVWCELLGGTIDRFGRRESRRINDALRQVTYLEEAKSTVRFGKRYGRQRGFYRTWEAPAEEDNLGLD